MDIKKIQGMSNKDLLKLQKDCKRLNVTSTLRLVRKELKKRAQESLDECIYEVFGYHNGLDVDLSVENDSIYSFARVFCMD